VRRPTGTELLGAAAGGLTVAVLASEVRHIWRRSRSEDPQVVARETVEVAVAGYRDAPARENAALNLLVSYAITAGVVRLSTTMIRSRGAWGPFRNRAFAGRHIHHLVPGIALAFVAGGASIVIRDERADPWLALPFGVGAALTLDEAALLVELEDVYWSEEGILSVQVTLATVSVLGALALGMRTLRRGEEVVGLSGDGEEPADAA
jgi:hypothetical protein